MLKPVFVIGNNSHQPVSINYQAGDEAAVGTIPQLSHGLLTIIPGKSVTIEQTRVNYGQIHTLVSQNLLTLTESYL